jgi:cation:H+ antiporter
MSLLLIAAGTLALVIGANWLVQGASSLAAAVRISPLVIGLTVVAFGTSAPELAVSVSSAYLGAPEIAIGNVVGSNIFNILLILGCSALITPLSFANRVIRIDIPLMIAASLVTWWFCSDGMISRMEGCMLFGSLIVYTLWLIRISRREGANEALAAVVAVTTADEAPIGWCRSTWFQIVLIFGGLLSLTLGSKLLVAGAVAIAQSLGISQAVIGLTIIAGGTSLPEVATSVMAAFAGEKDIAVGNVIGSNLFNLLCVLGVTSIVSQAGLPVAESFLRFDLPVMVAVAIVCVPIALRNRQIGRLSGGLLLCGYVGYTLWLIQQTTSVAG